MSSPLQAVLPALRPVATTICAEIYRRRVGEIPNVQPFPSGAPGVDLSFTVRRFYPL